MHLRDEGSGPTLVLLHGLNGSLHIWEPWVERLREDFRVVSIDLPPFGLSGPIPGGRYDGPRMQTLLLALFEELEIEQAVVVGHSLGGYYAAYFAAHAPERVRALALLAPAAYPQPLPAFLHLARLPVLSDLPQWILPRPLVALGMRTLYAQPERLTEERVELQFDIMRAPSTRAHSGEVLDLLLSERDREPQWIRLIEQPTLLQWGEEDEWVPLELSERWLEDLARPCLVTYAAAGHLPMEERSTQTLADLLAFLSPTPGGDPGCSPPAAE